METLTCVKKNDLIPLVENATVRLRTSLLIRKKNSVFLGPKNSIYICESGWAEVPNISLRALTNPSPDLSKLHGGGDGGAALPRRLNAGRAH